MNLILLFLLSTSVFAESLYIDLDQRGDEKVLAPHSQVLTQSEYESMMRYAANAIKEHYCGGHHSIYSGSSLSGSALKFCDQYKKMKTKDLISQQKLVKAYLSLRCDEKLKENELNDEQKKTFLNNCRSLPQVISKDAVSKFKISDHKILDLDFNLGLFDQQFASRAPASQDDEFSNKTLESIFSQE